jgi:hypothetical protein
MTSTAFRIERKDQQIDVFREGSSDPIVTQQAIWVPSWSSSCWKR